MHAFLTTVNPELFEGLDTLHINPDPSIGIDEVRQIQFFLSRKPIQSNHNTVVIHQAHLLTQPAQHALLKTLEEPPGQALIYLVTTQPDSLLPTILSRVQIIASPNLPNLANLPNLPYLLKKLREQEFTRETALAFLDQFEYHIHQNLIPLHHLFPLIHQTRIYLKANCNLKLCLSHLALGLQNC